MYDFYGHSCPCSRELSVSNFPTHYYNPMSYSSHYIPYPPYMYEQYPYQETAHTSACFSVVGIAEICLDINPFTLSGTAELKVAGFTVASGNVDRNNANLKLGGKVFGTGVDGLLKIDFDTRCAFFEGEACGLGNCKQIDIKLGCF